MSMHLRMNDGRSVWLPADFTVEQAVEAGVTEEGAKELVAFRERMKRRAAEREEDERKEASPSPDYCMCGLEMDKHTVSENHSPVSEEEYFRGLKDL